MKIGLEISYDGTSYFGWQKQTGGGTVQQVVEEKLSILSGTKIDVIGCGRTDTGVHASHRNYCYQFLHESRIQLDRLEEVAAMILQTNDFSAFTKSNSGLNHFECQIHESQWVNPEPGVFEYHIAANRFVRGMVRLIVGSCLNYSLEKISLDTIGAQIQEKKQIDKSWSVPAQGLTLVEVDYPEAVKSLWIDFGI